MSNKGLSNFLLNRYTKKIIGCKFLGVYPCDAYPIKFFLIKNCSIIFNLSPHYEKGSHFVAILKKNNSIFYFDSFGKTCSNKDIKNFLRKFNGNIYFNSKTIQHKNSFLCGFFCLAFLICCQKNNSSLNAFIEMFNPRNLNENDTIVIRYIMNEIKKTK